MTFNFGLKNLWLGRGSNTDQTAHEPLPAETLTTELLASIPSFNVLFGLCSILALSTDFSLIHKGLPH